jgi:hypothetical protein
MNSAAAFQDQAPTSGADPCCAVRLEKSRRREEMRL